MARAFYECIQAISVVAGANFSTTGQYRLAIVGSDEKLELAGVNARAVGVILDNPEEDRVARLGIAGVVPVELGATVAAGALLKASTNGVAITRDSTNPIIGTALEGGDAGEVIAVLLHQ